MKDKEAINFLIKMQNIFQKSVGRETLITLAVLFGMMLVTGLCLVILGLIYPHMKYFEYTEYSYYLIVSKMFEVLIGMVLAQLLIIVNQHFAWKKSKGNQEKKMEEEIQSTNQNNGSTFKNDYVQCT